MLLVVITEYHLSMSVCPAEVLSPILPPCIRRWLGPLKYYFEEGPDGIETVDFHLREKGNTLCLGAWLHRMDMHHNISNLAEDSLDPQHHHQGDLLRFFLGLRNCPITFEEVVKQVIKENLDCLQQEHDKTDKSLRTARAVRTKAKATFQAAHNAYKELTRGRHNRKKAAKKRKKRL